MSLNFRPVNFVPGTQLIEANTAKAIAGLSILDIDAGASALTTTFSVLHGALTFAIGGGATITGNGTGAVTLTGTLDAINTALTLPENLTYRGATDYFGDDTLTMTTSDGSAPLATTDQVGIKVKSLLTGTEFDDTFAALPGNERIDAREGTDTVRFDFKLTEASVKFADEKVIVDGPLGSHTVLTGVEIFQFADGAVNNTTGSALVDDLFYYSRNPDVWLAGADPAKHYSEFGWREGRDPNALFDTAGYLAANPDVKAAGVNPLDHYHTYGWREGRDPSVAFDTDAYLAAYQDVAAAHIDPLAHYLQYGIHEGRSAFADGIWS